MLEVGPKSRINNSKKSKNAKALHGVILYDLVARKNFKECVHRSVLVATVQKGAILVCRIQKMCNSYSKNPKPSVKILINTNVHVCAKNWLNMRIFRVLKAIP
jgi:hypothetical protein